MNVWSTAYRNGNIKGFDNPVHMVIGEEISFLDEPVCRSTAVVSWGC
jgi:hypothetical protein